MIIRDGQDKAKININCSGRYNLGILRTGFAIIIVFGTLIFNTGCKNISLQPSQILTPSSEVQPDKSKTPSVVESQTTEVTPSPITPPEISPTEIPTITNIPTSPLDAPQAITNLPEGAIAGLKSELESFYDLEINSQGDFLGLAGSMGVLLYDSETLEFYRILSRDNHYSIAWSPDGDRVAASSFDLISIWDITTGEKDLKIDKYNFDWVDPPYGMDWSTTGFLAISNTADMGFVDIWDGNKGIVVNQVYNDQRYHRKDLYYEYYGASSIKWSPGGDSLACGGSLFNELIVWDQESSSERYTITTVGSTIRDLDWSPNGKIIASAIWDYLVTLWNVDSGLWNKNIWLPDRVWSVAWSPDGRTLAVGLEKGLILLYDPETGNKLHQFDGHTDIVSSLDWSLDGTKLFSASRDGRLLVWKAEEILQP